MKLSEAILLGSTLRPQCRGELFRNGGSCAFGAAAEALGQQDIDSRALWPWLDLPLTCPVCGETEGIGAAIVSSHLNDSHFWTRERIAEWVATVEPAEVIAEEPAPTIHEVEAVNK